MGEDGHGAAALYFQSTSGPKRVMPGRGIEDIGSDLRTTTATHYSAVAQSPLLIWDQVRRICWWITTGQTTEAYAFQPQFESVTETGFVIGGWTRHTLNNGGDTTKAATLYLSGSVLTLWIGGSLDFSGAAFLASMSGANAKDVSAVSTNYTPSVTSAIYQPAGTLRRCGCDNPIVEWTYPGAATAISVSIASVIGGPISVNGSAVTDTTTSSTYTQTVIQEKLESIQLADITGLQVTVTWDTSVNGTERPRIHGVVIPMTAQERA